MQIIHDDQMGGLAMIPLIVDWRIPRTCQVEDCAERTTTIIAFTNEETGGNGSITVGVCEQHYREAHTTGKFDYTVKF